MGTEFAIDWSLYSTRQSTQLNLFQCRISAAERAFRFRASNWNSLSNETRTLPLLRLDSSRCQWNLDSGFQFLVGFRIPWAPESKAQDSRFHKQNFPGFRNSDSLAWGDLWVPCMGRPLSICMWQRPILTRTDLRVIWHSYTKSPTQ